MVDAFSVPFILFWFCILVTLRKVSRRASCKALRSEKVITIRRVCIVQYRIIFSFHLLWLNGLITLIRAETERYDIVRRSKVTTKTLASGTGSLESNKLGEAKLQVNFADFDSGQDIFFLCEKQG